MTNNCISVADFLQHQEVGEKPSLRFVVPIYQRIFAWGQEQIERLLLDIYEHFCLKDKNSGDYYLGVITVVKSNENEKELVLVDGQQRLTCIMLLGALLGLKLDCECLRYDAREDDNRALKEILAIANIAEMQPITSNANMNAFFRYAHELKVKSEDGKLVRVVDKIKNERVSDRIAQGLKLLVSQLPDNPYKDDINQQNIYFEKMNSGGRQLEPHEILKVRICSLAGNTHNAFDRWNAAIDFSKRFVDPHPKSDEKKNEADVQSGYTSRSLFHCLNGDVKGLGEEPKDGGNENMPSCTGLLTVEMFLLHVLYLYLCRKVKVQLRSDLLLDQFSKQPIDANAFIEKMVAYRGFLDEQIVHLEFDASKNVYDYCWHNEDDAGKNDEKNEKANEKVKLRQFQSMLFVADNGHQGDQRWLLNAYNRTLDGKSQSVNLEVLKGVDSEICKDNLPNGQNIESYVRGFSYGMQQRWLFWRLDYLLWEKVVDNGAGELGFELTEKEAYLVRYFRFHQGRSIEHLHPQTDNGEKDWNTPVGDEVILPKDRFGNLCLISSSLNSTLGNDSVAVKLARINDAIGVRNSNLQSVKMLFMYRECDGQEERWTPKAAGQHLSRMVKVLNESYLNGARDDNFKKASQQSSIC